MEQVGTRSDFRRLCCKYQNERKENLEEADIQKGHTVQTITTNNTGHIGKEADGIT